MCMDQSQRLKLARKEAKNGKGISQKELANIVGVTYGAISHIETGVSQKINGDLASKIARALDVDTDWLCLGTGKRQRAPMSVADLDDQGIAVLDALKDLDSDEIESILGLMHNMVVKNKNLKK